jgi:hypothetical protein
MAEQAEQAEQDDGGVRIHLVSQRQTSSMTTQEKIRYILDEVRDEKILVLEEGLGPREETELIEHTMVEIDPDTFIGIEMESYPAEDDRGWIGRLLQRDTPTSMTVVGPADKLETVHKDGSTIQAMVVPGKASGGDVPVAGA